MKPRFFLWASALFFFTQAQTELPSMPKPQTYYISGIAFDTQTYCGDYIETIEKLQKEIKRLQEEITALRRQHQRVLRQQRRQKDNTPNVSKKRNVSSKENRIIISDKPIKH